MIMRIKIFNRNFAIQISSRKVRNKEVIGYSNRTKDGFFIVTLDYDSFPIDILVEELRRIQSDFGLSTFYVFKSSESSYHAVCIDKVSLAFYFHILQNSSVDVEYQNIPYKFGKRLWVLRLSDGNHPIEFLCSLKAESEREKSLAHKIILENIFKIKMDIEKNLDKQEEVIFARYRI